MYQDLEGTKLRRFETVALLFNPAVLPPECMPLRTEYLRGLWLSLFHDFKGVLRSDNIGLVEEHRKAILRVAALEASADIGLPMADRALAHAGLSLFRLLYNLGYDQEAKLVYRLAARRDLREGCRWQKIRRYAWLCVKEQFGQHDAA